VGVQSFLIINDKAGSNNAITMSGTTNVETPGCVNRTFILGTPITVDNNAKSYSFEVFLGAEDVTTATCDARIHYRLQVSAAPGTATFGDVPVGSPFHRFVEAMVGAGITGGCGGGNYCPDSPVTRGQMAVFIAAALGLHWPN
jgi:S-layer family protein